MLCPSKANHLDLAGCIRTKEVVAGLLDVGRISEPVKPSHVIRSDCDKDALWIVYEAPGLDPDDSGRIAEIFDGEFGSSADSAGSRVTNL